MQCISTLAFALAATCATLSAQAAVIDVSFTGTVQAQTNAGVSLNSPVTGSFAYDTSSAKYLSYVIGGQFIATGYGSIAALSPDLYSALYTAQLSPVQQGGQVNSTFTLDLEALNTPWSASNAIGLLSDTSQLASDLDTTNSSFSFYTANADGSNVRSLTAQLTGLQVVGAVPEPSTLALLACGLGVIGLRGARRRV